MIKQAVIWYQRHVGSVLNLHPGVNTIIGDSDAGKTSIVRALDWIRTNRPSTRRMIPHGQKRAKVILDLEPGGRLVRFRSKSENYYKLGGEKFTALKKGVPEEILNVLNLADLNFHLRGSFLLHMTPPARAKYINDLVDLTIIDTTTTNSRRMLENIGSQYTKMDEEIEELEESLVELEWLDTAGDDLQKLERLYEEIVAAGKRHQSLQRAISDYGEVKAQLESLPTPIPNKTIRALEALLAKIDQTEKKADKLRRLIQDGRECWREMKEADKLVKEYGTQFNKLMGDRCPLCGQEVDNG